MHRSFRTSVSTTARRSAYVVFAAFFRRLWTEEQGELSNRGHVSRAAELYKGDVFASRPEVDFRVHTCLGAIRQRQEGGARCAHTAPAHLARVWAGSTAPAHLART